MSTTLKNNYGDLILAVVLVVVLAGAWWWLDNQINLAAEQLINLKTEVAGDLISEGELLSLQKTLTQTVLARALIDKAVITADTVDVLLAKLESVVAESGLSLDITNVTADKQLVVTLAGEGSFKQWFKFLQLILALDYGLIVDDLTWSAPVAGEEANTLWSGTLKVTVNNFMANNEK
ncbi:MAG: hypothetical protein Q7T49_02080 [bacterium]|nr:hypothetical protein [bacterium]